MRISIKDDNIGKYLNAKALKKADEAYETLVSGKGPGSEFTGWLNLPEKMLSDTEKIEEAAIRIRSNSDCLVVIGIGGSYLGTRALLNYIKSISYNSLKKTTPDIYFIGNDLSTDHISEVIEQIGERDFSVNVISKSGTTLEPSITFRIFRELLKMRYGDDAKNRIYVTTDKEKGLLKEEADREGYQTFEIPDDVGGRFSVLSAVGLLPAAVAGIVIRRILKSADSFMKSDEGVALAKKYAGIRYSAHKDGKSMEIFSAFNPKLRYLGDWWEQLFGESEGKEHKGLFPASLLFTSDLHSMGQYIQDGKRLFFETFCHVAHENTEISIPYLEGDQDRLNFIAGKDVSYANLKALEGTEIAHLEGGVPNIRITFDDFSEETFGEAIAFFELACGISGYMLKLNPFDQPGVEKYKRNMFKLLGKEE
ncbi:MAG: glucose-6-phosphate isomerase [Clostridia bacterium]|nr:glucose-6-phosphate isomerase [Clostridia bacterium]